jgi:hypothetical protein
VIGRSYETTSYETGGVFALISIPTPPSNARRVVRVHKAKAINWPTEVESARSLVAGLVVDAQAHACDAIACSGCTADAWESGWAASSACLDCEALRAACVQ